MYLRKSTSNGLALELNAVEIKEECAIGYEQRRVGFCWQSFKKFLGRISPGTAKAECGTTWVNPGFWHLEGR